MFHLQLNQHAQLCNTVASFVSCDAHELVTMFPHID